MTILRRMKAFSRSKQGKDWRGQIPAQVTDASNNLNDVTSHLLASLELSLEKVRESATLANLLEEAQSQLSDVIHFAREKLHVVEPLAKEKLEEARDDIVSLLPRKPRKRSKLRIVVFGFLLVSAALSLVLALKRRPRSSQPEWTSDLKPVNPAEAPPKNVPGDDNLGSHEAIETSPMPDEATAERLNALLGKDLVDVDDNAIGQITSIYYRPGEGRPEWAVVSGGLLSEKKITVPVADATINEKVKVAYPRGLIEARLAFETEEITLAEEMEADRHFNLHREAEPETSSNTMPTGMSLLRIWPPGFQKLPTP